MKDKRHPLSLRRLTILAGHYTISLGEKHGMEVHPIMMDFMKYVWEHKDDELSWFPTIDETRSTTVQKPTITRNGRSTAHK